MRLREAKEWIAGGIHKCCGAITVYLVWARTSIEPGAHACRLGHHRPLLQSLFCSVLENLAAKTWWRIQKERRARSSGGKILLEATRWFGLRPTIIYIHKYIPYLFKYRTPLKICVLVTPPLQHQGVGPCGTSAAFNDFPSERI